MGRDARWLNESVFSTPCDIVMIVTAAVCASTAIGGSIHDQAACFVEMQYWGQIQLHIR
jgi:hypothetical protein